MTDRYHLETDLPIEPKARKERIADAFKMALTTASGSPDMRLRMILGEAYEKYLHLCRWVAEQITDDDAKAPGTLSLAQRWGAVLPDMKGLPSEVRRIQQDIITLAAGNLRKPEAAPVMIEHDPAEPLP